MRSMQTVICFLGVLWYGVIWITPVNAFIGEYNSKTGNDGAIFAMYKKSEITYDGKVGSTEMEWELERTALLIGVSKAVNHRLKLFGGFNYTIDGEMESEVGAEYEVDSAYSAELGVNYILTSQNNYSVSGFGQLTYIIKEDAEWDEEGWEYTMDGYEVFAGVMGKYRFNPNFYGFGTVRYLFLDDITGDFSNGDNSVEWEFEREDRLGFQFGLIYDLPTWFLKGQFDVGSESGFGLAGGIKF